MSLVVQWANLKRKITKFRAPQKAGHKPWHAHVRNHIRNRPRKYAYLLVILVFLLCLGYFVWLSLQTTETITQVTARSEVVEIMEPHGDDGKFAIGSPRLHHLDKNLVERDSCLPSALLTPSDGSVLRLTRNGNEPLEISLRPLLSGGLAGKLGDQNILESDTISVGDAPCTVGKIVRPVRVPIFGPASIGSEFRLDVDGKSQVLMSGRLNTYVRALSKFLIFRLPNSDGVIIPAQSIDIPAGARLEECAPPMERVNWFGYAEVRLGSTDAADQALNISAETNAHRLALITPGGSKVGGTNCGSGEGDGAKVDVIGLSLLGRMTTDPNAALLPILLALALTTIGTLVNIHSLREPSDKQ